MAKIQQISDIAKYFFDYFTKMLSRHNYALMTVMTDDSFLNLRGKEILVNIYYNIYNTNHKSQLIFNNCHLSLSSKITHPVRY